MKRRAATRGKASKGRPRKTTSPKRRTAAAVAHSRSPNDDLHKQLKLRTSERDESLARETATSEVLKVISSSPGDLQSVFDTILESALRICDAKFGMLMLHRGGSFDTRVMVGAPPALVDALLHRPFTPPPGNPLDRMLRTKKAVHVVNAATEKVKPLSAKLAAARSHISVPMVRENDVIGAVSIYRQEVRPFTDKQIELVQNFAAQAVIAIENTRLLNELRQRTDDLSKSLEQQTGTSEVLKVISSSPGDLEPVFDTLLTNATRMCGAKLGALALRERDVFRVIAMIGAPPAFAERLKQDPIIRVTPGHNLERLVVTKAVVHIPDLASDKDAAPLPYELAGARAVLNAPLLKDGQLVGSLLIYRQEKGSFSEKQIELVQNFAAQAVIAIENTRLLNQLRESLQQQTATTDVLKVISSSPGDLEPVFDSVLENAIRICEANFGTLYTFDGKKFRAARGIGTPQALISIQEKQGPFIPEARTLLHRVMEAKATAQSPDYGAEPVLGLSAKYGGARSTVAVPMLKEQQLLGVIVIYRQEVRPFADEQIELLQNFASQAVIAVENTRLLSELRESLQQQTATADVLKVISRSTFDLKVVLNTLVESAARLCDAYDAVILLRENDSLVFGAHHGPIPMDFDKWPITRAWTAGRSVKDRKPIHVHDLAAAAEEFPEGQAMALRLGHRTILSVPLLRENEAIGCLSVRRTEVRPFTDKQVELARTFADQAVIAIENARLLNELRQRTDDLSEALDQQTATSEVLKVISSSRGELEPVFNAMLENATRICEANVGNLFLWDRDDFRAVAVHGASDYADWFRRDPMARIMDQRSSPLAQLTNTKQVIHIADLRQHQSYRDGNPRLVSLVDTAGARTHLVVPMLKDRELLGAIVIYRTEVRSFTDKQIELVQNFAAQAVIAIENTRLLNELRQRTDDLSEALEQQTATSEVLKVISSSPGELEPVFRSMLANAVRICGAKFGGLSLREGDAFRNVAMHGVRGEYLEERQRDPVIRPPPGHNLDRLLHTKANVHIPDLASDREAAQALFERAGARALLNVPLLKDQELIGSLMIYREKAGPFDEKQIALVSNFAAQAVIAIENTRLLSELRESLQQQTATSEVLRVISSSPGELGPVFQAMLENATRICEANFGVLNLHEDGKVSMAAMHNVPAAFAEFLQSRDRYQPIAGSLLDRVMRTKQVADNAIESVGRAATLGGAKSTVCVPMLKEDDLVGTITIYRQEVRPFSEKQIELVQNFAAQAIIAIENTRLLSELRESLQQQTATADVLKVISRSTFDLKVVLNTLVESAARLCEADMASINREKDAAYQQVASYGQSAELQSFMDHHPIPAGRGSVVGRAVTEGRIIHIHDVLADPDYKMVGAAKIGGIRTMLGVPLLREGTPVGVIALQRKAMRPFTEKQIELVSTFADQAVIAIENVRLFESVEARTRELAQSLEDLQTAQDRLVQTQKLASLGQLTAGIAHEIKNPLNFVNNFSSLSTELLAELRDALTRGQFDDKTHAEIDDLTETLRANLEKIEQHGKRADSIVKNMLLHSREGSGEHRPIDINAVVEESLNLAYHGARAEKQSFNITLERSFDPAAGEVDLFPQEITRVLLNLISNGFYAATKRKAEVGDNGSYEPILAASTKSLGDRVEIRIRDNGTGIPSDVKDRMFNPFFTTKPPGEGTGLGLSLSHDIIVKQHAGLIEVDTKPGEFTEFRIILPRTAASIAKSGGRA